MVKSLKKIDRSLSDHFQKITLKKSVTKQEGFHRKALQE